MGGPRLRWVQCNKHASVNSRRPSMTSRGVITRDLRRLWSNCFDIDHRNCLNSGTVWKARSRLFRRVKTVQGRLDTHLSHTIPDAASSRTRIHSYEIDLLTSLKPNSRTLVRCVIIKTLTTIARSSHNHTFPLRSVFSMRSPIAYVDYVCYFTYPVGMEAKVELACMTRESI